MKADATMTDRQFGLDWLRIGAFGILIFYHIGMFFVPWGWHVKTAQPIEWVQWPMMAVNPWRLTLLFLISGVVSRSLMKKLVKPGAFASSRSWRLLVPLAAGMAIFVAPQPWIELRDRGAYSDGFLHFWLNDYAEFGASRATPLPTWNHLWFVAYLWAYSMLLTAAALLPARARARLQATFDRLFGSWRLFALPLAWLFVARAALFPTFGETHALVDDPYAHAVYGFAFFFGVGLARSRPAWTTITRNWKLSLSAATLGCALTFYIHGAAVDGGAVVLARAATRALLAWGSILGLLGLAQLHLHRDGPVRRYLTEAIFPYYIAHQTIIVVVGYYLKQWSVGPALEFAGILAATILGCALTYEVARRISWLRPILGLKMQPAKSPTTRPTAKNGLPRPASG
jgi:peptidoglycan/LPS O-acetylase OafA/YrhL